MRSGIAGVPLFGHTPDVQRMCRIQMNVSLREGDRDSGFAKSLIDGRVQFGDGYQTIVQIGQVAAQQKVQRAVTESLECRDRRRILENEGMFLAALSSSSRASSMSDPYAMPAVITTRLI